MQPDATANMLDQLLRVILMDTLHAIVWVTLGAIAYRIVRK